MLLDAQFDRQLLQSLAVVLTFVRDEVWVGCTDHAIKQIRVVRRDRRERLYHRLNTLAGREQPECQQQLPPGKTEFALKLLGASKWTIRHAVGNEDNLIRVCAVNAAKQHAGPLGHDNQL